MYVGDIYIPTVSELSSKNAEREDYLVRGLGTDSIIPVAGTKTDANPIHIKGLLFKLTGTTKGADDYAEDLMALEERDSVFNFIQYLDTIGFMTNVRVQVPKDFRSAQIREYDIKGKFFPYSVYQHGLTYRGDRYDDGEYFNYPRMFILNQNATNVHLASSIDIIPLTPIAYIHNGGSPTPTNIIPIYRPFPVLDHSNYETLTGALGTDSESLDGTTVELDTTGEYVEWKLKVGTDIPRGAYKVKFRAKESTLVQDIQLDIVGSVSGSIASLKFTGPSTFEIYETATISFTTHEEITITVSKLNSPANTVVIDYLGLNSQFSVMVLYDLTSENGYGPVKMYDTIYHVGDTGDSPTAWKRVYSLRHKFIGDMVIANELMYWRIDTTKTWANTGILKLRDVETAKHLWSYSYETNYPDLQVVEISPYYIELESAKVGDFGIVKTKIIIDPLMIRLEVHKNEAVSANEIGITKSDLAFKGWHTTLTEVGDNMIASTTEEDGFFCIIPQAGYNVTGLYKHLLFDSFNKPTISEYIAKRQI
jgi:hypothetical protein